MEKEIYTPMEKILIEALKVKEQGVQVAKMDELLLQMEAKFNMMDGLTYEEWLL